MAPSVEQRTRLLRDFFVGRRDTFTEQQLPGAPTAYLVAVGTDKEKKPLTDPELMAHCRGERTISTYLVDDSGLTPLAMLDVDSKEPPTQEILVFARNWLTGHGLSGLVEPSGRKGYHIWVLFKARLPAAKAKRVLEVLMADWSDAWNRWAQAAEKKPFPFQVVPRDKSQGPVLVDFEGNEVRLPFMVEVNPKQAVATSKDAPGNCVKLPWGKHQITGKWTALLNEQGNIPEDWGLSLVLNVKPVAEADLDGVLQKYPVEEKKAKQRDKILTKEGRTEEFNTIAVAKIMEQCEFLKHCAKDAADLSRNQWWSMIQVLAAFGEPGAKKIHELSQQHPKYKPQETDKYIDTSLKAYEKDIGPHTCQYIQSELGFKCGLGCQAYTMQALSPAGLACKLATQSLVQKRTRSVTIQITRNGNQKISVNCPCLADEIRRDYIFKTIKDTEELLVYRDGVFMPLGECIVKEQVAYRLLDLTTRFRTEEVLHYVIINSYVPREEFDKDPYIINLENGLLHLKSMELKPHTPEYPSITRLPVTYRAGADCPRVKRFWTEVVGAENVPLIEELFGFCLDPEYAIHRAFLFVGDGANGKSTMIELLRSFLGERNCATVPLQAFDGNRFSSAQLWGKLANLYADLPTTSIQHTGRFKMLTGGDTVQAEEKYRSQFSFKNRAKLVFSANRPPRIQNEDSFAFWRRWIIMNFPNEFMQNAADKNLLPKLTSPPELSGVLNAALAGLRRLWKNGEFTYLSSVSDVTEQYMKSANPIYAFLQECCVLDDEQWTSKDEIYERFKTFCRDNKLPVLGKESFGRALKNCPEASAVKPQRHRIMSVLTHGWQGIGIATGDEGGPGEKERANGALQAAGTAPKTDGPEDIPF